MSLLAEDDGASAAAVGRGFHTGIVVEQTFIVSFCLETPLWKGFQLLRHPFTRLEVSAEPILRCFRPVGP